MSIKRRIFLTVLFLLSGTGIIYRLIPEEKTIAFNYYTQASQLISQKNYAQAEKLLNAALEFFPGFSDAYYLLAGIYLQNPDTLLQGIAFLQKGAALDNWKFINRTTAHKELATFLFRIKKYMDAKTILLKLHESAEVDAEVDILLIKTLNALTEADLLNTIINTALKRFPAQLEIYILAAEYSFKYKSVPEALRIIDNAMHTILPSIPGTSELLFYKAKYTKDPELKRSLVEQYFSAKGKKPEIAIDAIELDKENSRQYIEYFVENGGSRYPDLIQSMLNALAGNEDLLTYFDSLEKAAIEKGKSREKFLDLNGDGYYEEKFSFGTGGIEQLIIDFDQNGVAEALFGFTDKQPTSFKQWNKEGYISYFFSLYPFVKALGYPGEELDSEYLLVPFTVKYPVLQQMDAYRYEIDSRLLPFTDNQARQAAYRQHLYKHASGQLIRTRELLNGEITAEKIDTDEDGVFDYRIEYRNNQPVKAFRDYNNDGIPEAVEFYKEGKVARIEFDENRDGKAESVQFPDTPPGTTVTFWDYNFDGIYDARQQQEGNLITYEFATGYDAVFDLKVKITGGKISNIFRGKQEIPIIKDNQDNLYWIGKKGAGFKRTSDLAPGQYYQAGKTYFIFQYNHNIYIEEIQ